MKKDKNLATYEEAFGEVEKYFRECFDKFNELKKVALNSSDAEIYKKIIPHLEQLLFSWLEFCTTSPRYVKKNFKKHFTIELNTDGKLD